MALAITWIAWPFSPFAGPNVHVDITGQDVDRHGGTRILVSHDRGGATQRCIGGCDDVQLRESSSDNAYVVRVVDERGICVACSSEGYVTNGIQTRFVIAGADVLRIDGGATAASPTAPRPRAWRRETSNR